MITPLEVVIESLADEVEVPVVSRVPQHRPGLFVRVDAGAPVALSPVHDRTVIIVQVYGVNQEQVIELIGELREFMRWDIYELHDDIQGWDEMSGPVELPDPDLASVFRWQITGQLYTTLT